MQYSQYYYFITLASTISLAIILNRQRSVKEIVRLVIVSILLYIAILILEQFLLDKQIARLQENYYVSEHHILEALSIVSRIGFAESVLLAFLNVLLSIVSLNPIASEFIVTAFYINPLEKVIDPLTGSIFIALSILQILLLILHAIIDILSLYSFVKELPALAFPLLGNDKSKTFGIIMLTAYLCITACCLIISGVHSPLGKGKILQLKEISQKVSDLLNLKQFSPNSYNIVLVYCNSTTPVVLNCHDIIVPCPGKGPIIIKRSANIRRLFSKCKTYVMWYSENSHIYSSILTEHNVTIVDLEVVSSFRSYNKNDVKYVYKIVHVSNATISTVKPESNALEFILHRDYGNVSTVQITLTLLGPYTVLTRLPSNCTCRLSTRHIVPMGTDSIKLLVDYYSDIAHYSAINRLSKPVTPSEVPMWTVKIRCNTYANSIDIKLLLKSNIVWNVPHINGTAVPAYVSNIEAVSLAQSLRNIVSGLVHTLIAATTSFIPTVLILMLVSSFALAGTVLAVSGLMSEESTVTHFILEFVHSLVYDYILVLYFRILSKFSVRAVIRSIRRVLNKQDFAIEIVKPASVLDKVYRRYVRAHYMRSLARTGKLGIEKVYRSLLDVHHRETLEDIRGLPRKIYVSSHIVHHLNSRKDADHTVKSIVTSVCKDNKSKALLYYSLASANRLNILKLSLTVRKTPSSLILEILDRDLLRLTLARLKQRDSRLYYRLLGFLSRSDYGEYSSLLYRYETIVYKLVGRRLTLGQMYVFLIRDINEFSRLLSPVDKYVVRNLRKYIDTYSTRALLREYLATLREVTRGKGRLFSEELAKVRLLCKLYGIDLKLRTDESSAG